MADAINLHDFEKIAKARLPKMVFDYYASGAEDEITLKENEDAFKRISFRPRILRDVSTADLTTTILGNKITFPVMLAPSAMHCMATGQGEKATVRAAQAAGTITTISSWSTTALEDSRAAAPQAVLWQQLYVYKDREVTKKLVERAEAAGYQALVVTVDTPLLGKREADYRNKFFLPDHLKLANFEGIVGTDLPADKRPSGAALAAWVAGQVDASLTWKDIEWLQGITKMKIILKGVLCAEDAILSAKHGVAAIIVSNHGARQLDTDPATIDVLEEVVEAVRDFPNVDVYLDGGIRRGSDVLKALALGAKAVMIGRPVLYGLAAGGEEGVLKMLTILKNEFRLALGLCGLTSVSEINRSLVVTHQDRLVKAASKALRATISLK